MTHEEFENKYRELEQQECNLRVAKHRLEADFCQSLNEPYKHLQEKKVKVTYLQWEGKGEEKTEISYWGGYTCNFGIVIPTFYQAKKDGTMSCHRHRFDVMTILQMEEYISE